MPYSSPDRRKDDTCDHVFYLCSYPLFHQKCQDSLNVKLEQHLLFTDLEKRLIPQIIQLVLTPDGHRIICCLDNRNSALLRDFAPALLSSNSFEAIEAVLLDFSGTLVPRIGAF